MASRPKTWRITRTELAALLQVTPDRVTKMIAEGMPVAVTGGGRGHETIFDLAHVLPWLNGRRGGESEKARLDRERADEIEMRNAVTRGELAPTSEYATRWAAMVVAAKERLLSIPTAAVQRRIVDAAGEDVLIELVHEALTELSEKRAEPDDPEDE